MNFLVYLGVRTFELFPCFASFVFLGSVVLTSLFCFCFTSPVSLTGSYTEDEPNFQPLSCGIYVEKIKNLVNMHDLAYVIFLRAKL